jgi:hypothetical protein
MDNASDYESEDCRFESCQDRYVFFQGMKGNRGQMNTLVLAPIEIWMPCTTKYLHI